MGTKNGLFTDIAIEARSSVQFVTLNGSVNPYSQRLYKALALVYISEYIGETSIL